MPAAVSLRLTRAAKTADREHARARTWDRAASTPNATTRDRSYQAIPLINAATTSDATVGDVERAQLAVVEIGGAALQDLRRLVTTDPALPPLEANDMRRFIAELRELPTPEHWRRDGLTVAEMLRERVAEAHERVDLATLSGASTRGTDDASVRAAALGELVSLRGHAHAATLAIGVDFLK